MNLLPLVKCKLQEQQAFFKSLPLYAVIMTIVTSGMMWNIGGKGSHSHSIEPLIMLCIMIWMMLQITTFTHWIGKGEFWYALPYSKTQVFMVNLFVQQATVLVVLLSCFVVPILLGIVAWSSATVIALVDIVTCGTFVMIVLLCFFKPKEDFIEKRRSLVIVMFSFVGMVGGGG